MSFTYFILQSDLSYRLAYNSLCSPCSAEIYTEPPCLGLWSAGVTGMSYHTGGTEYRKKCKSIRTTISQSRLLMFQGVSSTPYHTGQSLWFFKQGCVLWKATLGAEGACFESSVWSWAQTRPTSHSGRSLVGLFCFPSLPHSGSNNFLLWEFTKELTVDNLW